MAEEDLHAIQAAVYIHAKRQKPNQQVISKGGLISAKDKQLKILQRVKKEAVKASRAAIWKVKKETKEAAEYEREAVRT